ncbi:short chain dehydrogenase reductase [Grosmannia clavigera kw1407]|uniref:Short chain dehydrogenase reductase n=1 Tax=Grosmannia clavigera (strain kw1407 / UAMH 11150) TaxID=655863 RepID=F0XKG6_GROCL|nr:short chain dehydrogenase reductase [Grosmannia clavigera kw1407]EFX01785.1 short chain dehydrogenase reductase [Grosmannia clavigera kw1407]
MAASTRTAQLIALVGRSSSPRVGATVLSSPARRLFPAVQHRSFASSPARAGQLDGKRIIVTVGAMGIGESVVRAYAAEGARVWCDGHGAWVGRLSACRRVVQGVGGLDVMVNVAGIQKHAVPEDVSEELVEAIMKVNLFGTLYTSSVAYHLFKKYGGGGVILNFGSYEGLTAGHHNAIYGATKGGVHTWTRSVAREWGPAGVRVNAVLPYVATPMYDDFIGAMSPEQLAAHKRELKEQFPLGGNLGDPLKDLGPVMVFLASDASHWMTGQLFPVDGGYVAVR